MTPFLTSFCPSHSRLGVFTVAAVLLLAPPIHAQRTAAVMTSAAVSREQTADQQVHHVLNRLGFGARPGDADAVRAMGIDRWIDHQLHPERMPDSITVAFVSRFATLGQSGERLLADYPPPAVVRAQMQRAGTTPDTATRTSKRASQVFVEDLAASRMARAVLSERQLHEVMVDFWENHFNVFAGKDRARYFLPAYDEHTIRPHVLGSFRELLGAVAKSPAMLYYLDNWQSVADSGRPTLQPMPRARRAKAAVRRRGVNENFARELMELHTLGVDGGYTQHDVMEVARALTGWTLARGAQGGAFTFREEMHDAGAKKILGTAFPANRGIEEGEAVLDLLASHPSTATFIATKLARRFVSDTPPPALVARAADAFRRSHGDIREVVRTIVTSTEFFATASYRAKVKSPLELVVSTMRAMNATPDTTARSAQQVSRLGQPLFGHQAPNGYPETGSAWMNTGAILNRINFGLAAASGRIPAITLREWPLAARLATMTHEEQVEGVITALFGGAVSRETREVLLTGTNPLLASPTPPSARSAPTRSFAQVVGLALGAPEFQRR